MVWPRPAKPAWRARSRSCAPTWSARCGCSAVRRSASSIARSWRSLAAGSADPPPRMRERGDQPRADPQSAGRLRHPVDDLVAIYREVGGHRGVGEQRRVVGLLGVGQDPDHDAGELVARAVPGERSTARVADRALRLVRRVTATGLIELTAEQLRAEHGLVELDVDVLDEVRAPALARSTRPV